MQCAAELARDAFSVEKLQFVERESFFPENKSNLLPALLFHLSFLVLKLSEYLIFIFLKDCSETFLKCLFSIKTRSPNVKQNALLLSKCKLT